MFVCPETYPSVNECMISDFRNRGRRCRGRETERMKIPHASGTRAVFEGSFPSFVTSEPVIGKNFMVAKRFQAASTASEGSSRQMILESLKRLPFTVLARRLSFSCSRTGARYVRLLVMHRAVIDAGGVVDELKVFTRLSASLDEF